MLEPAAESAPARPQLTTLYVNNLNEKISIAKTKYVLLKLFSRYGTVLNITAHKNLKMKGQAFVTYQDHRSCGKAMLKLQGRPVFKKPINVTYAKVPSDAEREAQGDAAGIAKRKEEKKARNEAEAAAKRDQKASGHVTAPVLSKAQAKQWRLLPPNSILLLQNVDEAKLELPVLEAIFKKYAGFSKVRLIKFRKLAFVDFELEDAATKCIEDVDHEQFGELSLLSYAKK